MPKGERAANGSRVAEPGRTDTLANQFSRKPKAKGVERERVSRYECPLIRAAGWLAGWPTGSFFRARVYGTLVNTYAAGTRGGAGEKEGLGEGEGQGDARTGACYRTLPSEMPLDEFVLAIVDVSFGGPRSDIILLSV